MSRLCYQAHLLGIPSSVSTDGTLTPKPKQAFFSSLDSAREWAKKVLEGWRRKRRGLGL
jgi:hypothetical protein